MTPADMAEVLSKCAAFDARTIGKADVQAWHEVLGDLNRQDALDAVSRWYREHRERIMPSDIRAGIRAIRTERLRSLPADDLLMAGVDGSDPNWTAIKADRVNRWADGDQTQLAITGGAQ